MSDFVATSSMPTIMWFVCIVASYFLGNISPAILISKASGFDIREKGSGNAGTTNMLRVMGKGAALFTLVVDIAKGFGAALLGWWFGGEMLAVICGLAVLCGHIWPLLFGFKGGKGIATGLGVLIIVNPVIAILCVLAAAAGIVLTVRVSVGAMLAALTLPVYAYFLMPQMLIPFTLMTIIIMYKHKDNIKRLIRGEEPRSFN
ncbi:MAG: glycerol-3-phosphate 1-O-acyltransferase PlsY [Anaerovoracaceae bacterium]|jgi:glycerol-3-phosphate acyltransferase PlsY